MHLTETAITKAARDTATAGKRADLADAAVPGLPLAPVVSVLVGQIADAAVGMFAGFGAPDLVIVA